MTVADVSAWEQCEVNDSCIRDGTLSWRLCVGNMSDMGLRTVCAQNDLLLLGRML